MPSPGALGMTLLAPTCITSLSIRHGRRMMSIICSANTEATDFWQERSSRMANSSPPSRTKTAESFGIQLVSYIFKKSQSNTLRPGATRPHGTVRASVAVTRANGERFVLLIAQLADLTVARPRVDPSSRLQWRSQADSLHRRPAVKVITKPKYRPRIGGRMNYTPGAVEDHIVLSWPIQSHGSQRRNA